MVTDKVTNDPKLACGTNAYEEVIVNTFLTVINMMLGWDNWLVFFHFADHRC